MFGILGALLAGLGWFLGEIFYDDPSKGIIAMTILAAIILLFSVAFSRQNALRSNKVRIIGESENPRLYNIVRKVSQMAEIPMPEVGISDHYMPNAFATGRGPKSGVVIATAGLMDMLDDDELEAVMAHEISHVKNRDILIMSVAAAVSALFAFIARIAMIFTIAARGKSRNPGEIILIVAGYSILPLAALMIQLGISRNREYLADEYAVRLTGKPHALASALTKIEEGCDSSQNKYDNPAYSAVWISNPEGTRRSLTRRLFSTHPDTKARVDRIMKIANEFDMYYVSRNRYRL